MSHDRDNAHMPFSTAPTPFPHLTPFPQHTHAIPGVPAVIPGNHHVIPA